MARLMHMSMQTGAVLSEGIDAALPSGFSFATDRSFTQTQSLKMASSAAQGGQPKVTIALPVGRAYFQRTNVYIASGTINQPFVLHTLANPFNSLYLMVDTDGHLYSVHEDGGGLHDLDLGSCPRDQWFCLESRMLVPSSGSQTIDVRVNGVAFGSQHAVATTNAALTFAALFYSGDSGSPATPGVNVWMNDWCLNDDQGANQNTWAGRGAVWLLLPVADNAKGSGWQKPGGSTTNIYTSVDNVPPNGLASTTSSGNAERQARNATRTTTSNYDVDVQSYTAAGIGAQDTINVVQPIAITGRAGTAINLGLAGVSNPAAAEISAAAGPGAAGTFPTNWSRRVGTLVYAPSVTRATSPVVRVGKRTANTADVMVCQIGLLVDVTPDSTAPTATIASVSATRISRQTGKDTASFTLSADEAFVEYEIRAVPDSSSPRNAGSLIETNTVSSTASTNLAVTDDELIAAVGLSEGTYVIKAFVRDAAGNWST